MDFGKGKVVYTTEACAHAPSRILRSVCTVSSVLRVRRCVR